jgi:Tfp pilus assembly protein PilE
MRREEKRREEKRREEKSFTLIELIIVIIIVTILALISIPKYFANIQKAKRAEAVATMHALRQADLAYYAVKGTYFSDEWPISSWSIDIDGDGICEIAVSPSSNNWIYIAASNHGYYIQANPIQGGNWAYCVCVESGKVIANTSNGYSAEGSFPCP